MIPIYIYLSQQFDYIKDSIQNWINPNIDL